MAKKQGFLGAILPSKNRLYYHIAAVIIIILANTIYFFPQLQGKKLQQTDLISAQGQSAEVRHFEELNNKTYMWTGGQFSGMPRLLEAPANNNLIWNAYKVLKLGFGDPIGIYIALMLLTYIMFVLMGIHPLLSILLSIAVGLSTNNIVLWEVGHRSKIRTLAFTPLIIAGVYYLFDKYKLLAGGILLCLGLTLSAFSRHPQMTYYIFMVYLVYMVVKAINLYKTGELAKLLKPIGVTVVCAVLAIGASASKLISIYEYNESSMRGKAILTSGNTQSSQATSSSQVEGLDWDYAMQWSNGFLDVIASYIPGLVGGSTSEKVSRSSEMAQRYRLEAAPLYWGELPFTEGSLYLGAVFIFLFVFGLFYTKGSVKWWLGISMLMLAILSMGKHFALINKLFFDYFPVYNKFRTPQSILSVAVFFIPILGALAINKLVKEKEESSAKSRRTKKTEVSTDFMRSLKWSVGICGGIALFFLILGGSILSFSGPSDAQYAQSLDLSLLISDRKSMMIKDSFRTFVLVALSAVMLWLYAKDKVNKTILYAGIGLLAIIDLAGVSWRYLAHSDFVSNSTYQSNFQPRPVDQAIMSQEPGREYYRVFDVSVNTFNSPLPSNFHNNVGGYHPAKLQRYADMIEYHLTKGNQQVLNMLNTKYIIQPGANNQAQYQLNNGALGNAWFVDNVQKVTTPHEEINALNNFNPASTAVILDQEFNNYIGGWDPQKDASGQITLSSYEPDHLTYDFNASTEQLVIFSEIWYGPNKGWQAYIDGTPVDHIRANYCLRALRVPSGSHKIEFVFKPESYHVGETINLISSLIQIFGIGLLGFLAYRGYKKEGPSPVPEPMEETIPEPKRPAAKRKKKTKRTKK